MNWKNRRVLITGGAGFIGSHLSEKLSSLGTQVTILDLISKVGTTKLNSFTESLEIKEFDILKKSDFQSLDKDYDYIYHLAGITSASEFQKNPELGLRTNVNGTENVLEFASKINVKKLIFPSTAFVYGKYPKYVPIDENHPIDVTDNFYSLSKKQGEDLCNKYIESKNLPVVILRLFTTFGPKQSKDYFIPTVILQAIKSGKVEIWSEKPKRDFVYIEDTVSAMIKSAETDYVGKPINIGSGNEVSIGEVGRLIAKQLNAEFKSMEKDVIGPMRLLCDYSLAKRILDWEPKISFEEGLSKTIKWFLENSNLY